MNLIRRLLFITFIAFSFKQGHSQGSRQLPDMHISFVPGPVVISGRSTFYYELHLTSSADDTIGLRKIEMLDNSDSAAIASIEGEDLKNRYAGIGVLQKNKEARLPPGSSGVIYIELALQKEKLPAQLSHRIELEVLRGGVKKTLSIRGAAIPLSQKPPLVVGPPLGPGLWTAVYDPSWERGHRRVFYTVNGKARIPGRFAIDFIRMDSLGRYANGDENVIKNWYGYGVDVLAVSDGIVASIRDDFPESNTLSEHPAYTPDKATGNFISLDLGNDHLAFYEHLKPGSIRVKPGQKVKKGDIIASLGFTGQTTGPHLHFHIADGNSPLGAEGIPFVFDHFTVSGAYNDLETFGKARWIPGKDPAATIVKERPAPNTVIKFQP